MTSDIMVLLKDFNMYFIIDLITHRDTKSCVQIICNNYL